jgi:hypothetical protein
VVQLVFEEEETLRLCNKEEQRSGTSMVLMKVSMTLTALEKVSRYQSTTTSSSMTRRARTLKLLNLNKELSREE